MPDMRASWALGQFPFIAKQQIEIAVIPFDRIGGPRAFNTAGDGIAALARSIGAFPAKAHFFDRRSFRFSPDQRRVTRTMRLAKGMTTGNQSNGFLVIHRHTAKGLAHILGAGQWIWVTIRAFWINVDQPHLNGGKRVFQVAFTAVPLVAKPVGFNTPVNIFFRGPNIFTATAEPKGFAAHRFDRDITGQDQQVSPADVVAIFLLDRPQQAPRLVKISIIRPAVQRGKTLGTSAAAPTAVTATVGPGGVPCHTNEKRTIVTIIGGPPFLRIGHQIMQIFF